MSSLRICSPNVVRIGIPPSVVRCVRRTSAPVWVRVSSCSTWRAVLDAVRLERGGDAVVREELEVRVERRTRWHARPSGRPSDGGTASSTMRALLRAALGGIDRVPPADAVRSGVGGGRGRPVALAADRPRREHARHVPRAAVDRRHEGELAALVEHARHLRVAVEAPVVLRMDERPVLVERLGRDDHPPLVAEVRATRRPRSARARSTARARPGRRSPATWSAIRKLTEPAVPKSPTSAAYVPLVESIRATVSGMMKWRSE